MKVFVIDDDKFFTEPLVWCLEQKGWLVTLYKSVDDVFDKDGKFRDGAPDCIILDILMPWGNRYTKDETKNGKGTGLRMLQDIVAQKTDIPIIIITVCPHLDVASIREKYGPCVKEILVKPVAPTRVLQVLEQIPLS